MRNYYNRILGELQSELPDPGKDLEKVMKLKARSKGRWNYLVGGEKVDTKEKAVEIAVEHLSTWIHELEQLRDKYDKMLDDIQNVKMEEHGNS